MDEIKEKEQNERRTLKHIQLVKKPIVKKRQAESEEDESEYSDNDFENEPDEIMRNIKKKYRMPKNVWIIKPGENTNRGNGIEVASNLNDVKQIIQRASTSNDKEKTFIIQKYIDYPLLIHHRKFDIRGYGVMTSINGQLKGYFYEDAYIRTACREYNINEVDDKFIHLTNDAI